MIWDQLKYFKEEEFQCACCGRADMDFDFLKKLDKAREIIGHPITINSGFRCPAHNNAVSSTGTTGPHVTGKAADLGLAYIEARNALPTLMLMFSGIGINQKGSGRFIHVDELARRIWTY